VGAAGCTRWRRGSSGWLWHQWRDDSISKADRGQRVHTRALAEDSAVIELSRHDAAQQTITTQIVTLGHQGMHLRPVALRYAWPSELDLMAQQAGLRLRERYSGWDRRPFESGSGGHVSIFQRD